MSWFRFAVLCLAACTVGPNISVAATDEQPLIEVRGPTVIAFCAPMTDVELDEDPNLDDMLADFQLYASRVRDPLHAAGIEFQELYVHSFELRDGSSASTFRPVEADVGYYFVAPGKPPRVQYGVMTDLDIVQTAREYFGNSMK